MLNYKFPLSGMVALVTSKNPIFNYRISSNNSQGRLFLFSHQKGAIIRGKAIIRGRRLFQIFLTGGCALNILFYHPSNKGKSEICKYYH